ncbi:MAG: PDDEXK nuclease domain-containing protein [Mariprofundales bacterium]
MNASDYGAWLSEVKSRISSARTAAAWSVNRELILLYWDIGRGIVQKQQMLGWGKSVVERLAHDLREELPGTSGFSADNLWRMRQFFSEYSLNAFLEQLVPDRSENNASIILEQTVPELLVDIPWGHHIEIMKKEKEPAKRIYYFQATARFGWTRKVLLNQIKVGAYEHSLAEGKSHNFPALLPDRLAEQAEEMLKSAYNMEFLGIHREIKERELESRLIDKLNDFILELGYGFCFIGRQHRVVLGNKEYFIDLLFYHRFLKCLVAIELKIGEFEPKFAGKMDFYLNLLNDRERSPDDNPSIGIILCVEKDDLEVEFALRSKTNPIGVAEYQLKPTLLKELRGKLPSAKELGAGIGLSTKQDDNA